MAFMNRVVGVILAGFLLGSPVRAGEFKDWLKKTQGEHYQQAGFQLIDPKADAFLIRKLDQIPMKLLDSLIHGSYPQAEVQKEQELNQAELDDEAGQRSDKPFVIGKTPPVNVARLINKIHQIIRSRPDIVPVLGSEHRWSPEAQRYMFYGFWHRLGRFILGKQKEFPSPLFFRSKLFLILACGWTSRYAVTGQEEALKARIMKYPDHSVKVHDLFRESYLLNKGNIYLTFLTAENILAGDPYRTDRGQDPLQKKLAYLRNDSSPKGDNYGAWYHFFGIGLYGAIRAPFVSRAVAEVESFGSLFLEGPDRQEDYINRLGAIFGRKMNRLIEKKLYLKPLPADARTDYMLNGCVSLNPPPGTGTPVLPLVK